MRIKRLSILSSVGSYWQEKMLKKYSMRVRMADSAPFQEDTAFVKDDGRERLPFGLRKMKSECFRGKSSFPTDAVLAGWRLCTLFAEFTWRYQYQ
jgi:hypothetical protein